MARTALIVTLWLAFDLSTPDLPGVFEFDADECVTMVREASLDAGEAAKPAPARKNPEVPVRPALAQTGPRVSAQQPFVPRSLPRLVPKFVASEPSPDPA